jgi:hypothetical protein
MKAPLILAALLTAATPALSAADDDSPPRTNMKELLKARLAEDAKKTAPPPAPKDGTKATPAAAEPAAKPAEASPDPAAAPAAEEKKPETNQTAAKAPATVMPKVEVKKGRITVLDQKLAQQEKDIERERKNMKASEVDVALNDVKIAKPLALFGGDSAQFRQRVASERVALMEAEKDLIEAIAQAKTKEERQELQKQLDELKTARRQLDQSLR